MKRLAERKANLTLFLIEVKLIHSPTKLALWQLTDDIIYPTMLLYKKYCNLMVLYSTDPATCKVPLPMMSNHVTDQDMRYITYEAPIIEG